MSVRVLVAAATLLAAVPVWAEPLTPEAARRFVVGKTFAYSCFDGTRGSGRIQSDLSVIGTMQVRGAGPMRLMQMPAGTLKIKGGQVCATVRGMPFDPCFNIDRTAPNSFRGSISGMPFAYCDFTRRVPRARTVRTSLKTPAIKSAAATPPAAD